MIFCFGGYSLFAQIQRKVADTSKVKGTAQINELDDEILNSKKKGQLKQLKELNLTSEQKVKLKQMRQATDAKRTVIMNDVSLTTSQRQAQLKANNRSMAVEFHGVLNEEQKKKMKEMRKVRKNGIGAEMMFEE